jgi:hypothetical protein
LVTGLTKNSKSTEYPAAVLKKEIQMASTKTTGREEILT